MLFRESEVTQSVAWEEDVATLGAQASLAGPAGHVEAIVRKSAKALRNVIQGMSDQELFHYSAALARTGVPLMAMSAATGAASSSDASEEAPDGLDEAKTLVAPPVAPACSGSSEAELANYSAIPPIATVENGDMARALAISPPRRLLK